MCERVNAYFEMLKKQSSTDLDRSAKALVVSEKENTARLIAHIAEIGDRRYHLALGYKNLFEYCVKRVNLSEGSVCRRTQVAGVCRRYPQILEALSTGTLNLTSAGLIAPHITEENAESLITNAEGKTKRELEVFLISLKPKEPFKPSMRKQPAGTDGESSPLEEQSTEKFKPVASENEGNGKKPAVPSSRKGTANMYEPAHEDRYNFRFSAVTTFSV